MTYTLEQALQRGFDVFEAALGSLMTEPDVESGWKNLFRFKAEKNLKLVNRRMEFFESLCTYMGECAAEAAKGEGLSAVRVRHVNEAFPMVQARAFELSNGPTPLC